MIPDHYTYLLVNIGVFLIPFLFSFHPKLQFIKTWKSFLPAVFLTGSIFIAWDIVFTDLGVWSFNDRYVMGWYIFSLPIEEWLFFFCIPYSCMFTHYCLKIMKWQLSTKVAAVVRVVLIVGLLFVGIFSYHQLYTSITFICCAALLLLFPLMNKNENAFPQFLISYFLLLIPFLISNGILTGSGLDEAIVQYNSDHILNIRVFTIPVEDFIYGLMLILTNIVVYEKLQSKTPSTLS
ncbi:MAG: lycopene cyclase domain-containing protein [Bacteroidetes bacterium]|nr:lycopene cyclase domain-containing protein [Bacteroidota bacterium]